jgi:leader peptidase (prepilin peptidase)/N-methyltransferase
MSFRMTSLDLIFGTGLVAILLALAKIDWSDMILPDWLNALLAATGLLRAIVLGDPSPLNGLIAAALMGSMLLVILLAYRRWRDVEGLGLGDVKLASAGAIWTGIEGLGPMLLIATLGAALAMLLVARREKTFDIRARFPFGPFLCLGVFAAWIITQTANLS